MLNALVSLRPFTRIKTIHNPSWNEMPKSILEDISFSISLERLYYPNKPAIYNTKAIVNIYGSQDEFNLQNIMIPEHKELIKYCKTYLIDNYYRDLRVYNRNNELLISRCWFNYCQNEKLLQILNVHEIFDYYPELNAYLRSINKFKHLPNFSSAICNTDYLPKDKNNEFSNNKDFFEKLRKLSK